MASGQGSIRFRLPAETRDFPFLDSVHVSHSVTSRGRGLFVGGFKGLGSKTDYTHPSSEEVKNTCIYTFTPMRLHGVVF
jgi:hypothetical protein